jgi:hypothetical protein
VHSSEDPEHTGARGMDPTAACSIRSRVQHLGLEIIPPPPPPKEREGAGAFRVWAYAAWSAPRGWLGELISGLAE